MPRAVNAASSCRRTTSVLALAHGIRHVAECEADEKGRAERNCRLQIADCGLGGRSRFSAQFAIRIPRSAIARCACLGAGVNVKYGKLRCLAQSSLCACPICNWLD